MTDLNGRVVIVTGASKGLGRSMATHLGTLGANVALVARSVDELESIADAAATEALVAPADVRDAEAVEAVVEATLDAFGRIDGLVNNAGVDFLTFGDERKPIVETTEAEWDTILDVNLKGVFLFTKGVLPTMLEQGSGNVVNVSSGLGRRSKANAVPYSTSKWAVEGFTRGVALEVASAGVNVNCLDPGGQVNTQIWNHLPAEKRRSILQPDVMDAAAAQLVAQGPGGVTGESMTAAEWERQFE